MRIKPILILLTWMCAITQGVKAQTYQDDYFIYEDEDMTMITGLTDAGTGSEELTIPQQVTVVKAGAFWGNDALSSLIIDGGNPVFELENFCNALSDVSETLTLLDLGSGMTADNIKALINGIGETNNLETVAIDQCKTDGSHTTTISQIEWSPNDVNLSDNCHVILPAELVEEQTFGNAQVYGYFNYTHSLSTFSGKATFYDIDSGSHWLFYVPTELDVDNKQVSFQRVWYVIEGEGVLIHSTDQSSKYVGLPRYDTPQNYSDKSKYSKNMLVGVTNSTTTIADTNEDGTKTNLILYEGKFYPTTGGLFPICRAYLQVPTDDYNQMKNAGGNASLSLVFEDDTDGISQEVFERPDVIRTGWYTLGGQRMEGNPTKSGIYIHDGRLEIVK